MIASRLVCKDEERRNLVRNHKNLNGFNDLNGLDYLEVSEDQRTITVYFLGKAPLLIDDYDFRLGSFAGTEGKGNKPRNLVFITFIGNNLHIRIFDASGKKIVDKPENKLVSSEVLTALKKRLSLIQNDSFISK